MARVNGRSYPAFVPSPSMLVGRMTPASSSSRRRAQATASLPAGFVPPDTTTSNPEGMALLRQPSMATVIFSFPNFSAAFLTRSGARTAARVHEMDSLDHPAVLHVETGHDSNRFHVVHTSFPQGERVVVPESPYADGLE